MFYVNGDYNVFIDPETGTKIRIPYSAKGEVSFPESIDLKVSDRCHHGCAFCHEMSTPDGGLASLESVKALASQLVAGTEIAVGGGNLMEDIPHTRSVLEILKAAGVFASITVRQDDFLDNLETIDSWREEGLVYGIGVSLSDAADPRLIPALIDHPTAVLHAIVGLFSEVDAQALSGYGLKILFLGYKERGRGGDYLGKFGDAVSGNTAWLAGEWSRLRDSFSVMAFDGLAIEQLSVKEQMSEKEWDALYAGAEGDHTFYIDLVGGTYAQSSACSERSSLYDGEGQMRPLSEMFAEVHEDSGSAKASYRHKVFETNSSSVHTLVMCRESEYEEWVDGKRYLDLIQDELVMASDIPAEMFERDEEEFAQDYMTYQQFWKEYSYYYETFQNTYDDNGTISDPIIAFGYYGHD